MHWNVQPAFSPDETQLLYKSEDPAEYEGFRLRSLDGSATDVPVPPASLGARSPFWAADDSILYSDYEDADDAVTHDIWVLEPGASERKLVVGGPGNQQSPATSPDGSLLAYTSNHTGGTEVWVASYPPRDGETPYQVSSEGGAEPHWSGDGRTIWYYNEHQILAAELVDGEPRTSDPVVFLEGIDSVWDIAADGSFVVTLDVQEPPRLRMILNWFEDLKAKVPTGR